MKQIKIKLDGGFMPKKNNLDDAGWDVCVPEDIYVKPKWENFGRQIIPLGFCVELPKEYAFSVRPRSGYSSKGMEGYEGFDIKGEDRLFFTMDMFDKAYEPKRYNADVIIGLCDCGYRGQYGVIIKNDGEGFWLKKGTRIAQLVLEHIEDNTFIEVDELSESERGQNGYGSSDLT